jgi:hypothetical protein
VSVNASAVVREHDRIVMPAAICRIEAGVTARKETSERLSALSPLRRQRSLPRGRWISCASWARGIASCQTSCQTTLRRDPETTAKVIPLACSVFGLLRVDKACLLLEP